MCGGCAEVHEVEVKRDEENKAALEDAFDEVIEVCMYVCMCVMYVCM
jgi:hypothetical protein